MTELGQLSPATQDYLKAIWSLGEWDQSGVTITALAARLHVRTSTASDGVRKLAEQGFVEHAPYGAITLTDSGAAHAVGMVRRHRLLETYLATELGYGWDQVHEEAESLEHAVSDDFINRIDAHLGHPARDPHGDPIPPATVPPHAATLSTFPDGAVGIVVRISDSSPQRLQRFAAAGIVPDAVVTTTSPLALDAEDAAAIWVIPQ